MTVRRLLLFTGLLAAAAAAWVGYSFVSTRPIYVEVARVEEGVPVTVFGVGTVEAQVLSKVGFETSGTIRELLVDHGDIVEKGEPLGRLKVDEAHAKLAKSQAAVQQATAAVARAKAHLDRARVILAQRVQSNERRQSLVARGAVSREAAEDTQAAEDIARNEVTIAEGDVRVAEAALRDAQSQQQYEEVRVRQHVLTAPFRARVIARHRELGSVVGPGEAVFTLVDPDTIWVRAFIDEAQAGGLVPGMPAQVRLRSLRERTIDAEIVRVDLESDRVTEERRVYVRCTEHHEPLFLGEQAEVVITKNLLKQGIFVPLKMVEAYDGLQGRVWTVKSAHLQRTTLKMGPLLSDGRIQVHASEAEAAVVIGGSGLREGQPVRLNP